MLNNFFKKKIIKIAVECIKTEVKTFPSFGLVSKKDSGCHKDMNFDMFLKSANTFFVYFEEIYDLVIENEKIEFENLQKIGQKQEKIMFSVTKGVNTHKGLVFAFG
ncbi:MAG: triphosphoribosyl-dephospho-CoA synthase, partial [Candidatus Phytoplasma australasiaticum]|nr:triphosphoribosyl-dephospho-CoA synthase [Candidatus Phytoplasma australasiaticum]